MPLAVLAVFEALLGMLAPYVEFARGGLGVGDYECYLNSWVREILEIGVLLLLAPTVGD